MFLLHEIALLFLLANSITTMHWMNISICNSGEKKNQRKNNQNKQTKESQPKSNIKMNIVVPKFSMFTRFLLTCP